MLRKTLFDVIYQNVNITAHMSPDILSISYTDNEDGQVDDISITLKNDDGKYFVSKRKKYKVLNCNLTAKVLDGQEERMKEDIDICLLDNIFNFIQTEYYNQIVRGEYYGGADE